MMLKIWIIFALGWLVGAACAIEVGKEIADEPREKRQAARWISGLLIVAMATTAACGLGFGLFYVIVWTVNL